jgi:lysozyme
MKKLEEAKKICVEELLVPFEAYARKLPNGDCMAYPDPGTKDDPIKKGEPWTIGYGSTFDEYGTKVRQGDIWTHEKAVAVKAVVVNTFLLDLLKSSPKLVLEPPRRIAAVLSWVYNCGMGNYRISTFKKKIDEGNWMEAAEQCKRWNKANGKVLRGLTIRRSLEAAMILMA